MILLKYFYVYWSRPGTVAPTYTTSDSEGGDWRTAIQGQPGQKVTKMPHPHKTSLEWQCISAM
jgi:hypothetical protein